MGRLTPRALRLAPDETKVLRDARVALDELTALNADELVLATDERLVRTRAAELVGVASLLTTGVISSDVAYDLVRFGVSDRDDLAERSAEALFFEVLDRTPWDSPVVFDFLSLAVDSAAGGDGSRTIKGWSDRRKASGLDPMLEYWRHCYGDAVALPGETAWRLRIPTQRVSARVVEAPVGEDGLPLPPLGARQVSCSAGGGGAEPDVLVGHESWSGAKGALAGLSSLAVGAELVLVGGGGGGGSAKRVAVVRQVRSGDALAFAEPNGELVVVTRPRRTWDADEPQQVVAVAAFDA